MPRIPEETVEQVLAATDIVDLIGSYFPLKRAGSEFKALCPFHNEKTPSFHVNPGRQTFKCFGCGEGGSAVGFVMKYENLPFQDALRKLAQRANISIEEAAYDPEADKARRMRTRLVELHKGAAEYMHHLLLKDRRAQHARDYLKSRGYDGEMARRWLVGWMPETPGDFLAWAKEAGFSGRELVASGLANLKREGDRNSGLYLRFRDRLMFPIRNDYGDIIAFSGRQLREDPRSGKYINSPETSLFKKSRVFFGLDTARRSMAREHLAILCEGQIDVIACHEAGFEHAVAALGTAFTAEHARLLKRYTNTVVVCFDSDAAGHKAAERAFRELAEAGLEVRVANLPKGEDPDSLLKSRGTEAFAELISGAQGFFDYMISQAEATGGLSEPSVRAELGHHLADLASVIGDKVTKDTIINHLSVRLGIGVSEFREAVVQAERRPQRNYDRTPGEQRTTAGPTPADRSVLLLCQYALQSPDVLDWLCEQTETVLDVLENRPGSALLRKILSKQPASGDQAKINAFLSQLPEPDQAALLPALEQPVPEDPLAAAAETLGFMSQQKLQRDMDAKLTALSRADLAPEELRQLQQEILDLQNLLKNSPARFRS